MHRCLAWFVILSFLVSCTTPIGLPVTTGPTSTASIPAIITPEPTETPPVTETPAQAANCTFAWSERELPEVSDQVNEAFQEAGFREVAVEARAYGENCIDVQTNQVVRFTAMQTDFHVSVVTTETDNTQLMGEWAERVMRVLRPFQPGDLPGPNPGYVGITFGSGGEQVSLWFLRARAEELISSGVTGSRLFEALQTP